MEPITNNEFLNSVLEAEAWKEISDNESIRMDMLDKYSDKLDWDEISENRNVIWTLDGINKFASCLNWGNFSQSCPDHIINEVTLQKFANRWDWKAISNRDCFYNDWHSSKSLRTRQTGVRSSQTGISKSRWSFSPASSSTYRWQNFRIPVSGTRW